MSSPSFELENLIVRAGAGAGKTTNLTAHVMSVAKGFKKEHQRWPRLVVTTFTKKATQELRERLVFKACEEGDAELINYFSSSSQVYISTMHGVFSLFIKQLAHLVGFDSQFNFMSAGERELSLKKILNELVFKNKENELLLKNYSFSDLLQIVTDAYAYFMEFGELKTTSLDDLLSLRLKAYQGLDKKMGQAISDAYDQTENAKWHLFLEHLEVCRKGFAANKEPQEILESIKSFGRRPNRAKEMDESITEKLKEIESELKLPCWKQDNWGSYLKLSEQLVQFSEEFCELYLQYKLENSKIEICDLELFSTKILRDEPSLADSFASAWDYWLIDEYQDTSPLQVKLLEKLIGDRKSYIVGDPQQSIYLFRGARTEVFKEKEQEFSQQGKVSVLDKNYRSQPGLLLFFNDFFAKQPGSFSSMQPREEAANQNDLIAEFYNLEDKPGEIEAITGKVKSLISKGCRFEDICILSRKHKNLKDIAQKLKSEDLPTHLHSSEGFYNSREVLDACFLLKFLHNPHDDENLISLLRTPYCRVDDAWLVKESADKEKSFWLAIKESDQPMIKKLKESLRQTELLGLSYSFEKSLLAFSYFDLSQWQDATGRRESNLWKLVCGLREAEKKPGFVLADFLNEGFSMTDSDLQGNEGEAVASLEPDCINMMTVHKSKGLQFPHIVIADCGGAPQLAGSGFNRKLLLRDEETGFVGLMMEDLEEGTMVPSPVQRMHVQSMRERELEESDRLFYVALTRAKESATMTWSGKAHKNSWLGRSHFDLSEGTHEQGYYSYLVSTKGPDLGGALVKNSSSSLNMSPFSKNKEGLDNKRKISVSQIISDFNSSEEATGFTGSMNLSKKIYSSYDGTVVHQLMEHLKYNPDFDYQNFIKENLASKVDESIEAVEYIKGLTEPPLLDLISQGSVEWGFQYLTSLGIVEGQIDLWAKGESDDECWVVDYKSGHPKYKEKAKNQLELYALPMFEMGFKKVNLVALYPMYKEVFIDQAPSKEEILEKYFT